MPAETEMQTKVAELVGQKMPSADISRISARPYIDSDGEKSLAVTVVVRERPPSSESARLVEVVDEFRTWLAAQGDDRFPYFRLLSVSEERELQQIDS